MLSGLCSSFHNADKPAVDVISTAGLVVYYDFELNNITSTSVKNLGTSPNGTISGTLSTSTNCKRGSSSILLTNGVNQGLNTTYTSSATNVVGDGFTFSVWVNVTGAITGGYNEMITISPVSGGATSEHYSLGFTSGTQMYIGTSVTNNVATMSNAIGAGWINYVVTAVITNSTTNICTLRLYKGGIGGASFVNQPYQTLNLSNNLGLNLGVSNHINGLMDEFRYYSRVLSASEITALATNNPFPN